MDEADLIVSVGARFDDRITGKLSEFAPHAKFVHIDIDPAEISKNIPAHIPIVGDALNILPKLHAEYRALDADPARLEEWWSRIKGWQQRYPLAYEDSTDESIKPQRALQAIAEIIDENTIITTDIGQHQMWAAQYIGFQKPRKWLQSGGLGTMGFGLPAAMGAKVGCPDELVVCVVGRRLDPDEHAGAVGLRDRGDRRQDGHPQQRLPRHGPPVAGAVLGSPLLARSISAAAGRTSSSSPRRTARPASA